jgi:hypothetical protein
MGGTVLHSSGRWAPRRSQLALGTAAALALAALIGPAAADSATTHTKIYSTPGVYTFTVPSNVTHIMVNAVGAAGGACLQYGTTGGEGASDTATFAVEPGSKLIIGVGGVGGTGCGTGGAGGANGGGAGGTGTAVSGAGGGGASGVLVSLTKPLIVAGGGGGASGCGGNGGNADSPGTDGSSCNEVSGWGGGGGAGTVSGGGAGGAAGSSNATAGGSGTTETGGAGGNGDSTGPSASGGGGGGGLYGGGGGGGSAVFEGAGGGGGGASFVSPKGADVTAPAATASSASVTITYTAAPRPTAITRKATGVKSKSATLHGSVNGHGLATTYWFQWGTSKHYGHKTSSHKLKASSSAKAVMALLGKLKSGTRYHFRVVAKNASGTSHGKDMTFTTKAATATGPVFTG